MSLLRVFRIVLLAIGLFGLPFAAHAQKNPVQVLADSEQWLNTERPLTAQDLQGRVILLDFWTYCCINCMHVIPDLHYLEQKYGDRLTVIGVHSAKFANEKDSENIRQAMLRHDIEHPVINDADFRVWKAFGVHAWPSFVLIAPTGEVAATYSGEGQRRVLDAQIERLITRAGEQLKQSPLPLALEKHKEPQTVLQFPGKLDIAPDIDGAPMLFVADSGHNQVLGVRLDGQIALQIGSGEEGLQDGALDTAAFHSPQGVLWDEANGILFVADTENHALRAIDLVQKQVTTLAGDGTQGQRRVARNAKASETRLASPWDLAFYPDTAHIAIAMAGTHQLWVYDRNAKTLSVMAGNGRESIDDGYYPINSLSQPSGLAAFGGALYFVDAETSSLRRLADGAVRTLIGTGLFDFGYATGTREEALMQHPLGLFGDASGIYVADSYNHAIRRFDPAQAELHDFAGTGERGDADGARAQAHFNEPNDIVGWQGDYYVADTNNHRIRVIDGDTGMVRSLSIQPPPTPIAYDPDLPETLHLKQEVIAPGGATLAVHLEPGWKINDEAPSYLALYRAEPPHALVESYDRETLKNGTVLPDLQAGNSYVLQGTIYYCEDEEGSICLIRSVEQELIAADDGSRALRIPVQ